MSTGMPSVRSLFVRPFIVRLLVHPLTPITHDAIAVFTTGTAMKRGTNIQHVSGGHCCKDFQGQRSKVKVMTRTINL